MSASYCVAQDTRSQDQRPTESQVKAAYLYNFGKFITWPAHQSRNQGVFEICIIGKDPFGSVLDSTVAGESINGQQITIKRLTALEQASGCRILFVGGSEENRLRAIFEIAERFNLLTVGGIRHFAERGGAIGFVEQQDRIRFEVNRTAAGHCGLVLSSELLKVAQRVIEKGGPGN